MMLCLQHTGKETSEEETRKSEHWGMKECLILTDMILLYPFAHQLDSLQALPQGRNYAGKPNFWYLRYKSLGLRKE